MTSRETVTIYDSQSEEYHRAFQAFLDHTDQKIKAQSWLKRLVERLPSHEVFIDAGAGNGQVTSWFVDAFDRTIAIEPNALLREDLKKNCPQVKVLPGTILDADVLVSGDLVLCSHVLYYIDSSQWMAHLERLVSWLAATGVVTVVLQNHDTDCMQMLEYFFGRRFDLTSLAEMFKRENGDRFEVSLETVPAQVTTSEPTIAYTIAEFMLNLLPITNPFPRSDLEAYVEKHFARPGRRFLFSCDQDFLQIYRK
jgi:hypothetical protein